jgi:hypothetical protein
MIHLAADIISNVNLKEGKVTGILLQEKAESPK